MKKYYNKLCKCGCGKKIEIQKHHKQYGIPYYILGHSNKGVNNPMYGKKRNPSKKTKRKQSIANKEENNPMFGKKRPDLSKYNRNRKITGEMKGENNPNYGGKCYSSKRIKYKNIWFKSSWEVIVAKWLDKNNYTWQYEPKRFYFKDEKFTYLPDFYVKELDSYIEVKGYWDDLSKEKIRLFNSEYPNESLFIIDGNNIENYKIKNG